MELIESWIVRRLAVGIIVLSSRRRHTRFDCDWSSDVCSSDLAALWDAHHLYAVSLAGLHILLTKEAPIGTMQFGGVAEGFLVVLQGRFHLLFIARVSLEYLVLRDQPLGTFREKDFVAEFQRCLHLAALDQIRVGFKDGIDFLGVGNLFSLEHATARLIDHTLSQLTVVVDLFSEFADGQVSDQILAARFAGLRNYPLRAVHDFLGHSDEFAIFLGLSFVLLLGRQPLDFLHPSPCRPRALAKPSNTLLNRFREAADQARDHAYDIP